MNKNIINSDILELNKLFFEEFIDILGNYENNEVIMIWLSGWSSVTSFYNYLSENYLKISENIRNKIKYCFVDERIVPLDHKNSNYKQLKDDFLGDLVKKDLLKEESILNIWAQAPKSLGSVAKNYFEKVKKINIWLFGVWPDGHTCSLFPNHSLLDSKLYWYLEINDSPKPPSDRITISPNMLKDIKNSFVFFIWEWKKEAYLWFLDKNKDFRQTPTKLILDCKNSFIITDISLI